MTSSTSTVTVAHGRLAAEVPSRWHHSALARLGPWGGQRRADSPARRAAARRPAGEAGQGLGSSCQCTGARAREPRARAPWSRLAVMAASSERQPESGQVGLRQQPGTEARGSLSRPAAPSNRLPPRAGLQAPPRRRAQRRPRAAAAAPRRRRRAHGRRSHFRRSHRHGRLHRDNGRRRSHRDNGYRRLHRYNGYRRLHRGNGRRRRGRTPASGAARPATHRPPWKAAAAAPPPAAAARRASRAAGPGPARRSGDCPACPPSPIRAAKAAPLPSATCRPVTARSPAGGSGSSWRCGEGGSCRSVLPVMTR